MRIEYALPRIVWVLAMLAITILILSGTNYIADYIFEDYLVPVIIECVTKQ